MKVCGSGKRMSRDKTRDTSLFSVLDWKAHYNTDRPPSAPAATEV